MPHLPWQGAGNEMCVPVNYNDNVVETSSSYDILYPLGIDHNSQFVLALPWRLR
jgi:hypothetical protein